MCRGHVQAYNGIALLFTHTYRVIFSSSFVRLVPAVLLNLSDVLMGAYLAVKVKQEAEDYGSTTLLEA